MKLTRVQLGDIGESIVVDSRADTSIRARIRDNAPHSHYAVERSDIHKELTAFKRVCEHIGHQPDWGVLEMFGGSGWQSAIIQKLVMPWYHTAWDISADCVESIRRSQPKVNPVEIDSFRAIVKTQYEHDWIHADYNLMTRDMLLGPERDPDLGKSLAAVFINARQCVTITDTTPYSLAPVDLPEWYKAFAAAVRMFFGWHPQITVCWGPAAMHVFRSEPPPVTHMLIEVTEPMPVTVLESWNEQKP